MYFDYGEIEIEYLKSKDVRLAEVIEKIGHINRAVDSDAGLSPSLSEYAL